MAIASVLSVLLVGCADDGDAADGVASLEDAPEATTGQPATEELDQEQAVMNLVECLRAEGLDVADPEVDSDGNVDLRSLLRQGAGQDTDRDETQAAMEACADFVDAVRVGFTRELDFTELQDQLVEFAACMRDNGYDMPDPDFSSFGQPGEGGPGGGPFSGIDPDDPDFLAAQEQCQDSLPGFRAPGGGGGGGRP